MPTLRQPPDLFGLSNQSVDASGDTSTLGAPPVWSDPARWDRREDGTPKGQGYFGLLARPDGGVSGEISVGVNMNGKEMDIPTMVPTLTQQEVQHLLHMDVSKDRVPDSIIQKATDYARYRLSAGKPVFAQPGEENPSIYPQFARARLTGPGASLLSTAHSNTNPLLAPDARAALLRLLGGQ